MDHELRIQMTMNFSVPHSVLMLPLFKLVHAMPLCELVAGRAAEIQYILLCPGNIHQDRQMFDELRTAERSPGTGREPQPRY